jgi:hypothetical protein
MLSKVGISLGWWDRSHCCLNLPLMVCRLACLNLHGWFRIFHGVDGGEIGETERVLVFLWDVPVDLVILQ